MTTNYKPDDMVRRYVCIWFCHLAADWHCLQRPELRNRPLVLAYPSHGKLLIASAGPLALKQGITPGMALADAKAIIPDLEVIDAKPELEARLLNKIAKWLMRYSPSVSLDPPEGLIIDATGCSHLWKTEQDYITEIGERLQKTGYTTRISMADTAGCAWAHSRYGSKGIIQNTAQSLLALPPQALRLENEVLDRLAKLGLRRIADVMPMPRKALRRRFGDKFLTRLDQALGYEPEYLNPIQPVQPYHERLYSLEPIRTAAGIEIAIRRLLEPLCERLSKEHKGARKAILKAYRVDSKMEQIGIATSRPSNQATHLFKLFELKISSVRPGLGIELFTLDIAVTEDIPFAQESFWETEQGLHKTELAELIDKLAGKIGPQAIHRYLPAEHYWPERSVKIAGSLTDQPETRWRDDLQRPLRLLARPEPIKVTAPIPDYPPMAFRYKGIAHHIRKADGPERIEQEWWISGGEHRDYYQVEDEQGKRYWLFRLGHYTAEPQAQWFIHGFFA